jgi:hypothetical protein
MRGAGKEICVQKIAIRCFPCVAALSIVIACALLATTADAQEHRHPPQDAAIHLKFYSNWMMPDNPNKSCCNLSDCYPTEIKFEGQDLYARRREDGKWLYVPPQKIERNRDNPDGRNHVCAPPPRPHAIDIVFCFTLGGAI